MSDESSQREHGMVWGVSSSAFQNEGAFKADGRGPSIWDTFLKRKMKGWDPARDPNQFYYQYSQDLALMRSLGIRHFRTSFSWSRIFPTGQKYIEQKGVDHYDRFIDTCLEKGIEPWMTLYHWDLPQALQDKGGWGLRDIVSHFNDYAHFMVRHFGDRVKRWMVLNEPIAFTGLGHFTGLHAPGKRSLAAFLAATWHALLCQGSGISLLKSERDNIEVGTCFSMTPIRAYSNREQDLLAQKRADVMFNRLFIEPLLGLGIPSEDLGLLERLEKFRQPGDLDAMHADPDFIGVQNYTRHIVRHSSLIPYAKLRIIDPMKRGVPHTSMGWEIHPKSLLDVIQRVSDYDGVKKIYVTENGAAFNDDSTSDPLNDEPRRLYIEQHIEKVMQARMERLPIAGYFLWTFTDNLEWAEGYTKRFGIVHVDHKSRARRVKLSGQWYSKFVQSQHSELQGQSVTGIR